MNKLVKFNDDFMNVAIPVLMVLAVIACSLLIIVVLKELLNRW